MKKMRTILCSLLACLLVALALPMTASAAAKAPSCAKKQTIEFEKQGHMTPTMGDQSVLTGGLLSIKNLSSSAQITNLKSSDKKFTVQVDRYGVSVFAPGNKVKTGDKTKISFTVKQNGKSYKLSTTVTFKQCSNFKTFKIGNKSYLKNVNGYWMTGGKVARKNNVKITVVPKKGYKLDAITINYKNGNNLEPAFKTIKSGAKVSLKNANSITVEYHAVKDPKNYREVTMRFW